MDANAFVIVRGIAYVLLCIVSLYVIPYVKEKFTVEQLSEIEMWVSKAVACAEILFDQPKSGDKKLQWVSEFLADKFNKKKVIITDEQIRILIEDAVSHLNTSVN